MKQFLEKSRIAKKESVKIILTEIVLRIGGKRKQCQFSDWSAVLSCKMYFMFLSRVVRIIRVKNL
jgi:hypothetical protein